MEKIQQVSGAQTGKIKLRVLRPTDAQGVATAMLGGFIVAHCHGGPLVSLRGHAGGDPAGAIAPQLLGIAVSAARFVRQVGVGGLPHDRVISAAEFRDAVKTSEIGDPLRRVFRLGCGNVIAELGGRRSDGIIRQKRECGGERPRRGDGRIMPAVRPLGRQNPPEVFRFTGVVTVVNGRSAHRAAVGTGIAGIFDP